MRNVYVYVLDTMADWELGHVSSELHSGRFFKRDAQGVSLQTVGIAREPIHTMGGLTVLPDCLVEDIAPVETSVLLLPGAETWSDPRHSAILEKAGALLSAGATVCAICGATAALAGRRLLDDPTPATGRDFWRWSAPATVGRTSMSMRPLWRTAA